MGSLELHAAVTGGPGHAAALLGYHQRLFQLSYRDFDPLPTICAP